MSYYHNSIAEMMLDMYTCKSVEIIATKYQTEGMIGSFVRELTEQINGRGDSSGVVESFEVHFVFDGQEESYIHTFQLENDEVNVNITKNLTTIEDRHVRIVAKIKDKTEQYNISIEFKKGCNRKFVIEKILVNVIRNFDHIYQFYTLHHSLLEN